MNHDRMLVMASRLLQQAGAMSAYVAGERVVMRPLGGSRWENAREGTMWSTQWEYRIEAELRAEEAREEQQQPEEEQAVELDDAPNPSLTVGVSRRGLSDLSATDIERMRDAMEAAPVPPIDWLGVPMPVQEEQEEQNED